MSNASIQQLQTNIGFINNKLLKGTPSINFYKSVYRKYTNFSRSAVKLDFDGNISKNGGSSSIYTIIPYNNDIDLLSNMWIEATLPSITNNGDPSYTHWCNNTGCAFLEECEITIDGHIIDTHTSLWQDIYNEIYTNNANLNSLLNKHNTLNYRFDGDYNKTPLLDLKIPLNFWFCRHIGAALPLVTLKLDKPDIRISFKFRGLENLIITDDISTTIKFNSIPQISIWGEYILLDEDERKRLIKDTEILIEVVQQTTDKIVDINTRIELLFNFPVKQLIWVFTDSNRDETDITFTVPDPSKFIPIELDITGKAIKNTDRVTEGPHDYFNYQVSTNNSIIDSNKSGSNIYGNNYMENFGSMNIELNSKQLFEERNATYFRVQQPIQSQQYSYNKHIYLYSFALYPTEMQPTGICDFSKYQKIYMNLNNTGKSISREVHLFATSYNILYKNKKTGNWGLKLYD